MSKELSSNRKALYYVGNLISIIGFLSFISVFFTAFLSNPFEIISSSYNPMAPALIGFILIILGQFISNIGVKGKAGSGLILDPKQAREDLKPYSSQVGGMINDALEEIDLKNNSKETIKIRCRSCNVLNEEDARFCKNCGSTL
jgi:ribosomal protein L40E